MRATFTADTYDCKIHGNLLTTDERGETNLEKLAKALVGDAANVSARRAMNSLEELRERLREELRVCEVMIDAGAKLLEGVAATAVRNGALDSPFADSSVGAKIPARLKQHDVDLQKAKLVLRGGHPRMMALRAVKKAAGLQCRDEELRSLLQADSDVRYSKTGYYGLRPISEATKITASGT